MNNVILIGMPSSGKSTVGVLLAKNLGYQFVDSDILIQNVRIKLLHETISEEGIDGFLKIENEVNSSINTDRTVISTGGSAVLCQEAMEHLSSIGTVIYLKISFQTLSKRLGDYVHRGVIIKNGSTLRDMYDERCPLYEKYADVIIDEEIYGGSLSATIERALEAYASHKK